MIVKFDPTGKLLILPTMVGVKVIDWSTNKCRTVIGVGDSATLRFIGGCLCLGPAKVDKQMQLARSAALGGAESNATVQPKAPKNDSILISMAFNKRRFYIFSHFDPVDEHGDDTEQQNVIISRDILNEPPDMDDLILTNMEGHGKKKSILGKEAILRTTMGDIHIRLFPNETPKTVENFCTHSKNGYYDNVIFHRVIKGFMIQTGDPLGDGTGGESIWGHEFEDEFVRELRHDRAFTVSMANAGPCTVSFLNWNLP
jgi:peptidylprolyl isomerase domain and WD repeat-containing protein 1